jgi:hypothetical protein
VRHDRVHAALLSHWSTQCGRPQNRWLLLITADTHTPHSHCLM